MSTRLRNLSGFWVLILTLTGCSSGTMPGQRTNWSGSDNETFETQVGASNCDGLRAAVEAQINSINTCQSHSDCLMTQGMKRAGYACKEISFNRVANTQAFNDALNQYYQGCGRFASFNCVANQATTNQPCQAGRCVRNIDLITQ